MVNEFNLEDFIYQAEAELMLDTFENTKEMWSKLRDLFLRYELYYKNGEFDCTVEKVNGTYSNYYRISSKYSDVTFRFNYSRSPINGTVNIYEFRVEK